MRSINITFVNKIRLHEWKESTIDGQVMNVVFKMMNVVLKMTDFGAVPDPGRRCGGTSRPAALCAAPGEYITNRSRRVLFEKCGETVGNVGKYVGFD